MVEIDADRLLEGLQSLRSFGATGNGVVRPTYSETDMAARSWLADRMASAGLTAEIDGIGNVIGRSPNTGPAVVLGSHSDTQPEGGWLDGAMGVLSAIEVAHALLEDPETAHLAVDAVAWADEEGTYGTCLGSRSFVDMLGPEDFAATNATGESVTEALERTGLADRPRVALERDRQIGYLEAHIEQGPHLDDSGNRIGVVSGIVGIRALELTFRGEQNHAGSTPMPRRRDAAVALLHFGSAVQDRLRSVAGPTSVWTIGDIRLHPGTESIIPGEAWCVLQFRDPSTAVLDAMESAIRDLAEELDAAGGADVEVRPSWDALAPVELDPSLRSHLRSAAAVRAPDTWVDMPSAAVHDANVLAPHVPAAMLFIPSIGGVSHDFSEDSNHDDIVLGCQVFADAVASLLAEAAGTSG